MRIYNKYIISLALASGLINTALAFLRQTDIGLYFTVNIITYLVVTLLYVYLNPRARGALNTVGVVFLAGFVVVIAIKVLELISGR